MSAAALSGEKVRLVSREGHAFEVPREVAEVSMKIRDELAFHNSGSEGDDSGSEGDDQARVVHLYGTDAACLAKAIAFLTYHFTTPYYPADKPIRSNRFEDCVADCFDQEFVAKNVTAVPADREIDGSGKCDDGSWSKTVSLIDLARAAEYLEIDDMTDLVTVKVRVPAPCLLMRGCRPHTSVH